MLGDMIIKWVITKSRNYENNGYIIKEVYVIKEDYIDDSKFTARCFFEGDFEKELIMDKKGLYDKKTANIKRKERNITNKFKNKKKIKDNTWKCACCGKTIYDAKDCTVDHIKPKSSFKKDGIMSKESWEECWKEENLQILCHKCNQRKRSLSDKKNKELNGKSNKLRKQARKQRGKLKNKIRFGIKSTDEDAIELARRDSNCIDVKSFFKK